MAVITAAIEGTLPTGCPEDPEEAATVSPASAHHKELGNPLVVSSRVPGSTLTWSDESMVDQWWISCGSAGDQRWISRGSDVDQR